MDRLSALVLSVMFTTAISAAPPTNWSQFRGDNASGVADDQKPPIKIGPEQNVRWKVPVGPGFSSPVVWGEQVFLTTFEAGKLYTVSLDRATGKERWRAEAPATAIEAFHPTEGSPAASTPATDGKQVIVYFGSCGLLAYDMDGKELWKLKMPVAETNNDFGTGTSPILADGMVILARDLKTDSKILAVKASDGSLVWEKPRAKFPTAYASPTVWDNKGTTEIVIPGYGKLIGYDIKTGNENWTVTGLPAVCCTTPVVSGGILYFAGWSPGGADFQMPSFDDILKGDANKDGAITKDETAGTFLNSFFSNNDTNKDGKITRDEWDSQIKFMKTGSNVALAIKPGATGDATNTHVIWRATKGLPYVPSPLVYRNQVIMVSMSGQVSAVDATTGKPIYTQERIGLTGGCYASPVAANGKIYFAALDGSVVVVDSTSEPEIISKTKLGERIAATPAIVGDTLFVRTAKHLYAFGEK